jgi:hypothetical protein
MSSNQKNVSASVAQINVSASATHITPLHVLEALKADGIEGVATLLKEKWETGLMQLAHNTEFFIKSRLGLSAKEISSM